MTLDEQVFRKMGLDMYATEHAPLPPISSSWEVCAKFLGKFMRERGFKYNIESDGYFWWANRNKKKMWVRHSGAEVKNDDLAQAACRAFMGAYAEDKKD